MSFYFLKLLVIIIFWHIRAIRLLNSFISHVCLCSSYNLMHSWKNTGEYGGKKVCAPSHLSVPPFYSFLFLPYPPKFCLSFFSDWTYYFLYFGYRRKIWMVQCQDMMIVPRRKCFRLVCLSSCIDPSCKAEKKVYEKN